GSLSFLFIERFGKYGGDIWTIHGKESFFAWTLSHQLEAKRKLLQFIQPIHKKMTRFPALLHLLL
ncbi:hypothetical protein, partial [Phyllobacterium sp. P5_D12]